MSPLRDDLKRLLGLLPRWHSSDDGKPTPMAKRGGGAADLLKLRGDETFCLCGLALLAVEFQTSQDRESRLTALFEALRAATGTIKERPPGEKKGQTLGEWSDVKGRTVKQVEAAVRTALKAAV